MIASILWFQQTLTLGEGQSLNLGDIWEAGGFMMWPLGAALAFGVLIILWKLVDLGVKGAKNKSVLRDADELISVGNLEDALTLCNESGAPAATVLQAGLSRYEEGTERATQAIENAGAIEVAGLEKGPRLARDAVQRRTAPGLPRDRDRDDPGLPGDRDRR